MIGAILFVHRLSYKLQSFWQLWIWAVVSSDRVKRVDEICAKGILYMHLVFDFRIFLFIDWHMVMYTANYLAESYNVIYHHRTQGRSQPHSSGWARVPLSTFFLKFWLIFLIFPQILVISSLFWAHPGRPWLRLWWKLVMTPLLLLPFCRLAIASFYVLSVRALHLVCLFDSINAVQVLSIASIVIHWKGPYRA